MRIHSDILTPQDIYQAATAHGMRGVYADIVNTSGSRSRKRRFDVKLTGTSRRRVNAGTARDVDRFNLDYAATWDEWGMFIDGLFQADPQAIIGQYKDREIFREATYQRFDSLTAPYAHGDHKWEPAGDGESQRCKMCEAQFNWRGLRP